MSELDLDLDIIDGPGPDARPFAPLMSSVKMDWQTPPGFLEIVRKMEPIGLDPCTDESNPVRASTAMTPEIDGLSREWTGYGLVFCNPPYGRALKDWSAKMRDEGKRGAEIIGLVPARTDTRWWQAIATADAICFWRGRIKFVGAPASAPFPSAVPYWGSRAQEFRRVFEPHGWVIYSKQQALFPL